MSTMTVRELAEQLRVKPVTIRDWARKGRIPTLRTARTLRFEPEAVLAALRHPIPSQQEEHH